MTKSEIKSFLKSNNITEAEMDEMWLDISSCPDLGGGIVKKLHDQGISWRDLNTMAVGTLIPLHRDIEKRLIENLSNGKGSN